MADNMQQKYTNTYIDKTVGMVHEYINMVIQLRTQLQLANDLIQEKDQVISSLQDEKEDSLSKVSEETEKVKKDVDDLSHELITQKENARKWETECNAMKNKVAHMDSLSNQLNEMKQGLISKNDEVNKSNQRVAELERLLSEKDNNINNNQNQVNNLLSQITELRTDLSSKEKDIETLKKTISDLETSSSRKVINSKKSKATIINSIKPEDDDF